MTGESYGKPGAVLFDKDGTLFDFTATWGRWCAGLLGGLSGGDPALAARMGDSIGFRTSDATFSPDSPVIADPTDAIAARLLVHLPEWTQSGLSAHMNDLSESAVQVAVVPLAGVLDGLLARGLRLGLCTNDGEAPARTHLAHAGVADRFDFVAGFDSGYGAKPDPGPLLAFARAVDLPPARIVMVGDSAHDMSAGRAAGMVCVAVGGIPSAVALADANLPDISALADWIDSRA